MSEWRTEPLQYVLSYIAKGIPPAYVNNENENTIRVLNQKCNRDFSINYTYSRLHDMRQRSVPQDKYLQNDDILINSTGTGTAGRIAQLNTVQCPTIVDGHMIVLRGNEKILPRYLGYALKAQQATVLQLDEGSTGQTELNRDRLISEIEISYPVSLDEQNTITATLSALDARIVVNRAINHHLEQMARAMYNDFVDSGYGTLSPISKVAEINAATYSVSENWAFANYLDTSSITKGVISEIQYITTMDDLPSRARRKVVAGDVLFSTVRPNQCHYGLIASPLDNMLVSTGFAVLHSTHASVSNEFLYLLLSSKSVVEQLQAIGEQSVSAYPSIKPSDITALDILIPNDGGTLNGMLRTIFRQIANGNGENLRLAALRDTLLPHLMSGELSVAGIGGGK